MKSSGDGKLKKQIGVLGVFSISAGAMISSGLFILPGLVYAKSGPSVILAYIMAGIFVIPLLLSKVELITAMPKAGGSYFFIERSMGSVAGTIGGFVSWFSLALKSAFALVGIGAFAVLIFPDISELTIKLTAGGFCLFFTILNLVSVDLSSKIQNVIVVALIGLLILYVIMGTQKISVANYEPFVPDNVDFRVLFASAGMVFISFAGVTKIASVAEEVKNPVRNIPLGIFSAFVIVIFLYALSVFVTTGVLNPCEFGFHIPTSNCVVGEPLTFVDGNFAHSLTPLSDGGSRIFGQAGVIAMAIAAIFAFFSTANAGIMGASRFLMAMSRDSILPGLFSKTTKKFNTPYMSILTTGTFMILSILLLNIETLVKVASAMTILLFILGLIASIIMRESRILNYKPSFKSPLYPWVQVVGIIIYLYLLYEMGVVPLAITGGFIILSIVWHRLYFSKKNMTRKSAIVYILENMIPDDMKHIDKMTVNDVRKELDDIISKNDKITEDRFNSLVKRCSIIDLNNDVEMPVSEFLSMLSEKFSEILSMDKKDIEERFKQREEESTTMLRPGLAIPHILTDEENKFEMIIIRSFMGVQFTEDTLPAYSIFALAGGKEQRYFHLKALSLIVKLTRLPNFDRNWLNAKSVEELRNLILSSYEETK